MFGLQIDAITAPDGRKVDLETAVSNAALQDEDGTVYQAYLSFDVVDQDTCDVQPDRYHDEIGGPIVLVEGPWKLSWDLPSSRELQHPNLPREEWQPGNGNTAGLQPPPSERIAVWRLRCVAQSVEQIRHLLRHYRAQQ